MQLVPVFAVLSLSVAAAQPLQLSSTVPGAPFSADQVQEYRTLSNGTPVATANVIGHFFRDSQGRTRTESALKSSPAWRIEIRDPVAGVAYVLDDNRKVASRTPIHAAASFPNAQALTISLGSQTIDGAAVQGSRTTFPSLGGHPPLVVETWDSPDLKVTLLTNSSNGYSSKLVNLRRKEPDAALFRPPADYTIVDR